MSLPQMLTIDPSETLMQLLLRAFCSSLSGALGWSALNLRADAGQILNLARSSQHQEEDGKEMQKVDDRRKVN